MLTDILVVEVGTPRLPRDIAAAEAAHHAQIRRRGGTPKAIGATRHDILIAYYHIVRDRVAYHDLGLDWNDRKRSTDQQTRRLVRQLEKLGMNVITPAT